MNKFPKFEIPSLGCVWGHIAHHTPAPLARSLALGFVSSSTASVVATVATNPIDVLKVDLWPVLPPIYFLIVYILGNLFLLNLFVAILLAILLAALASAAPLERTWHMASRILLLRFALLHHPLMASLRRRKKLMVKHILNTLMAKHL